MGRTPFLTPATSTATTGNMTDELERLMPGFSKNLSTASGNINELLTGLPSPALARNAAAYYGVQSGMPGSEYVRNKGFDLYNTQANEMRQRGQDDLLKLLGTVSGTAVATPGQALGDKQATGQLALGNKQVDTQNSQFGQSLGFEQQQWQKQLDLLDKFLGGGGGPASGYGNVFGQSGQPPNAMDYSQYTDFYKPPGGQGNYFNPLTGTYGQMPGTGYSLDAAGWMTPSQRPQIGRTISMGG